MNRPPKEITEEPSMPDESVLLGQLAEAFSARVRQGQMPDIEDYARQHPELAERIRELFPTLMFLEGMAGTASSEVSHPVGELAAGQAFGTYRIQREVGRGGMGIVYEALHMPLNKRVALKVLPVRGLQGSAQLERFFREAKTAAALHHTNIVPVFDIGQAAGTPYYAMQFIDGRGLDQVLRDRQPSQPVEAGTTGAYVPSADSAGLAPGSPTGTTPPAPSAPALPANPDAFCRRVAELGIQAAEGLAYAHQRGVIHRDIKPSNLLLDEQGILWITDFGLARRLEDPALTHSWQVLGTPRYMSPEQAEAARRPVDHRTDVYSLGATLYELLAGRPVFDGRTPQEVVTQILSREPASLRRLNPEVPRDLETVVLKAMAKRPEDRYQTAMDLADDLRRCLSLEPIRARRIGPVGRTIRWCRRKPALASLTAVLVLVVAVGFAAVAWQWRQAVKASREAEAEEKRARAAQEEAQDHLTSSLYERARITLVSGQQGRRWEVLELLSEAENLRGRERHAEALPTTELTDTPPRRVPLPTRAELRSLAVEALRLRDVRLGRKWSGMPVALSADGRWAVMVKVVPGVKAVSWMLDITEGREYPPFADRKWGEEDTGLTKFALSTDGKLGASKRGDEPGITLWELPSGIRHQLPGPSAPAEPAPPKAFYGDLAFSPDGSLLAGLRFVGKNKNQILFWNLKTRAAPKVLVDDANRVSSEFAFSAEGRWLAYPSANGITLRKLDGAGETFTLLLPPQAGGEPVRHFAFSPNRQLLAAASLDQTKHSTILLWHLTTRAELACIHLDHMVSDLSFSPDSSQLMARDSTDTLHFFQLPGCREEWRQPIPRDVGVWWHADSRHLLVATEGSLQLAELAWDAPESLVATGWRSLYCFAFSPDGKWLVVPAISPRAIQLIQRDSGLVRELAVPTHPDQLRFRSDSRQLAVVSIDDVSVVLDVNTGKEIARLKPKGKGKMISGAFDAAGQFLVVRREDDRQGASKVTIWNMMNRKPVWQVPAKEFAWGSLSEDGRWLVIYPGGEAASFGYDASEIIIWDLTAKQAIEHLQTDSKERLGETHPQLSPDNRWLLTTAASLHLEKVPIEKGQHLSYVWSVPDGRKHLAISGPTYVSCQAFSPDGRLLAVGFRDGSAKLWDLERGEELFQWTAHAEKVARMQFTPDGTVLVSTDGESPNLQFLNLSSLRRQLGAIGLDW
jgi:serine/threonine protein kinase/WD40 repeat protein